MSQMTQGHLTSVSSSLCLKLWRDHKYCSVFIANVLVTSRALLKLRDGGCTADFGGSYWELGSAW